MAGLKSLLRTFGEQSFIMAVVVIVIAGPIVYGTSGISGLQDAFWVGLVPAIGFSRCFNSIGLSSRAVFRGSLALGLTRAVFEGAFAIPLNRIAYENLKNLRSGHWIPTSEMELDSALMRRPNGGLG